MKKRLPIASSIIEFFILISLAMASLFYLNGCTASALQIARDKASPENAEYWTIKRVVSAVKHENGDISVCAALNESDVTEGPELITINLRLSGLSKDTNVIERLRLRPRECFLDDATCYWYPIKKTKPGCEPVVKITSSSTSVLPVEKISVNDKNRHKLINLLNNFNKNQTIKERIFEIRFDEEDEVEETDKDNDAVPQNCIDESEGVFWTYWPARADQQGIRPVFISGVYEDNSTSLYYLVVPLAFAGDVVVVTVSVVALAFLHCPQCFANMNN